MSRFQPLSAKLGEVKFRRNLTRQHRGQKVFYPTHTTASENLKLLRLRAKKSAKIFQELKRKIVLSPFLELGGERCNRAAVLTSKMNSKGVVVDLSAESLESASFFCPKIGLSRIPLRICADAYHLPFANNSFAFIFTFQTLHHFPNPGPIISEIYRVLQPEGHFCLDEEPVKQVVNRSFWRRDYHLRWWEKILKLFLILPFISTIGKSEVSEGILEETFTLSTWERALNQFERVSAELIPFPFGPKTQVEKRGKNWLKPGLVTKIIISLTGGGIKALCQKKGEPKVVKEGVFPFLICPKCKGRLKRANQSLNCANCQQKFPIKNGILYLLPPNLRRKLYP